MSLPLASRQRNELLLLASTKIVVVLPVGQTQGLEFTTVTHLKEMFRRHFIEVALA